MVLVEGHFVFGFCVFVARPQLHLFIMFVSGLRFVASDVGGVALRSTPRVVGSSDTQGFLPCVIGSSDNVIGFRRSAAAECVSDSCSIVVCAPK